MRSMNQNTFSNIQRGPCFGVVAILVKNKVDHSSGLAWKRVFDMAYVRRSQGFSPILPLGMKLVKNRELTNKIGRGGIDYVW